MSAADLIDLAEQAPCADPEGDTAGIEYDGRDGNAYLTVRFAGVPAPFRLNATTAAELSARLGRAADLLLDRETGHGGRETGRP